MSSSHISHIAYFQPDSMRISLNNLKISGETTVSPGLSSILNSLSHPANVGKGKGESSSMDEM